jgi:hypothetical protein
LHCFLLMFEYPFVPSTTTSSSALPGNVAKLFFRSFGALDLVEGLREAWGAFISDPLALALAPAPTPAQVRSGGPAALPHQINLT